MINTLTDDTNDMAQEIISAALIACKAIDILKEIKPGEALIPGPIQDQWKATLDGKLTEGWTDFALKSGKLT